MVPLQDDGSNLGEGGKPDSVLRGRSLVRQKLSEKALFLALSQEIQKLTAGRKAHLEETGEELWEVWLS